MGRLRQNEFQCKCAFSERFATILPQFLILLEREWRQWSPFMKTEEQAFFRQAHRSLAGLLDMEEAER